MDGKLVAVKVISPDRIQDFDVFKRVRLSAPLKYLLIIPFSVWVLTEIVDQWNYVEATAASECGSFPWVRLSRSPFLPCIPPDAQRESG